MALLRVDNGMSEETDEVVRHDNKGVAGFGSPKVLGREFVGREVVLCDKGLSPVTLLGISILNLFLKCSLQVVNRREF